MNRSEVIDAIATEAGVTKTTASKVLDSLLNTITTSVAKGESVIFTGFGSFKQSSRAARIGKNPKTGEALNIPAAKVPKFSAGTTFKQAVSGK